MRSDRSVRAVTVALPAPTAVTTPSLTLEARLMEEMAGRGLSLRDAQSELVLRGEKKNAVKQAALNLKRMFA